MNVFMYVIGLFYLVAGVFIRGLEGWSMIGLGNLWIVGGLLMSEIGKWKA